jgi:L-aspartate semialdehyde sulfurtransferase
LEAENDMSKSYEEINAKIKAGKAVVLTAEEVSRMASEMEPKEIASKVDVVTTATFGAMCSSGCFINFGHTEPPMRMEAISLDGVPIFGGVAAVDAYIGATEVSPDDPAFGGAHLIESLIRGKSLKLKARAKGTDCYPRKEIESWIDKDSVNEIIMFNPRNAYQNYPCATNSTARLLYTYMGNLLPKFGNANYSTSGELSPLLNDPWLRTIGIGTPIFLGGARGFVAWNGTQFNTEKARNERDIPTSNAATLSVTGNAKEMSAEFVRAAYYEKYGTTLYVGIGIPIPVLDEDLAFRVSVRNRDIVTKVCDYGLPAHPAIAEANYEQLRSGYIEINGKKVRTAPLSSLAKARRIAEILKAQVASGDFPLAAPVQRLPEHSTVRGFKIREAAE